VPVEGTVAGDISVVGLGWDGQAGVLKFPAVVGKEGAERKLLLVARGPRRKQVNLKLARVFPEFLKADLGAAAAVNKGALIQTPLIIRIPAGAPPSSHLGPPQGELGQIIVETGHPKQPQLRILVSFAIKD
jgi:hypothetical protein